MFSRLGPITSQGLGLPNGSPNLKRVCIKENGCIEYMGICFQEIATSKNSKLAAKHRGIAKLRGNGERECITRQGTGTPKPLCGFDAPALSVMWHVKL